MEGFAVVTRRGVGLFAHFRSLRSEIVGKAIEFGRNSYGANLKFNS
jgi:hypothetical protein